MSEDLVITGRSSMAAMIFKGPPHWGHCSTPVPLYNRFKDVYCFVEALKAGL